MTTQLMASTKGKYKEKKVHMAIFLYIYLNGNHNLIDNKTLQFTFTDKIIAFYVYSIPFSVEKYSSQSMSSILNTRPSFP